MLFDWFAFSVLNIIILPCKYTIMTFFESYHLLPLDMMLKKTFVTITFFPLIYYTESFFALTVTGLRLPHAHLQFDFHLMRGDYHLKTNPYLGCLWMGFRYLIFDCLREIFDCYLIILCCCYLTPYRPSYN